MKKIVSMFICVIIGMSSAVCSAETLPIEDTAKYLLEAVENPTVASIGGEWAVIGLTRSGVDIPNEFIETYLNNAKSYVNSKDGVLHSRKYTEYSRVILALTAVGENPENFQGFDLTMPLYDFDSTVFQGINGAVWALIALDSKDYGNDIIKKQYVDYILSKEINGGGWALSETSTEPEADLTAMTLIALAEYRENPSVASAVDRGVDVLSRLQTESGGYVSYDTETSESSAQVLTAISTLGISYKDSRFVKNGKTLMDNLMSYKNADGSFSHTDKSNLMATEQCFYAIVAAKRVEEQQTSLFDMSDIKNESDFKYESESALNIPQIQFNEISFEDTIGHKNQKQIEELAKRGIISGHSSEVFAPNDTMTRAEFAAITVRALGLSANEDTHFADVSSAEWYSQYIAAAYKNGIVNGVSETEFNPNGTITTEEACVMIERCGRLCGIYLIQDEVSIRNTLAEFVDYKQVSDWAAEGVAYCFQKGISDRSVIEILPQSHIKRCTVAEMLYNMLKGANLI